MKVYDRDEVKRMLLQYHNLDGNQKLIGIDGVRKIMMRLGSIQYDPLNVVGRNPDLVLMFQINGITNTFYGCNDFNFFQAVRDIRIMHDL